MKSFYQLPPEVSRTRQNNKDKKLNFGQALCEFQHYHRNIITRDKKMITTKLSKNKKKSYLTIKMTSIMFCHCK